MQILLTHAYVLADDPAERAVMKPYPPLGVLYLAAYLKARGVEVGVFDSTFQTRDSYAECLARTRPRVVGISVNLLTRRRALEMIRLANASRAVVVLGGPEPINHAEEYLARGAHVVVAGEGELTLERLLAHLDRHGLDRLDTIPGIAFTAPGGGVHRTGAGPTVPDLDTLPYPDREACDMTPYVDTWRSHHGLGSLSLITARGCPYKCTWCSHAVFGFSHRRRSPANVAGELEQIVARFRPDMVWYADDVFTINHRWIAEYAAELRKRGLRVPFETISREDRLDEDVVRTLAAMGCLRLWIGAESGSQRVLDAMKRGTDASRTREMVTLARRYGIETGTFVMLGYDGESLGDIEATVEHLKAAPPDRLLTTVAYPIKGTEYYERVRDRIVPLAPWEETTDREVLVRGLRSKRFYRFATRWIAGEFALARERQAPRRNLGRLARSFANAKVGRMGMLLTAGAAVPGLSSTDVRGAGL
jgi:radical SAM superfamily enzyme YgiQ (UPF0313 family)